MIIYFIIIFLIPNQILAQTEPELKKLISSVANVDWSCVKPKVPYPCASPEPGIYLRYWEPAVLVATQRKINAWTAVGASNLQYHDAHVYDFPTKLPEQIVACPSLPNVTGGIHYRSEMDALWRSPKEGESLEAKVDLRIPIGNWGPLHPRVGFVVAVSSAVSSALISLRAVSISSMEMPFVGHSVIAPLDFVFNRAIDKMQMVYPYKSACMSAGENALFWAPGRESKDGSYVWLIWHYRECCKPVPVP